MEILIINGPNLNLLGKRDPDIYGKESFEDILKWLQDMFAEIDIRYFQSNHEGEIIDRIQQTVHEKTAGLIINAGAYSHYSYAIRDALEMISVPKIEVHLSHLYKRESFRHTSVISPVCDGMVAGFGKHSYKLAVYWFKSCLNE